LDFDFVEISRRVTSNDSIEDAKVDVKVERPIPISPTSATEPCSRPFRQFSNASINAFISRSLTAGLWVGQSPNGEKSSRYSEGTSSGCHSLRSALFSLAWSSIRFLNQKL